MLLTYEYVKNYFEKMGCKLISNEYKSSHEKLSYICNCGMVSEISWNNFHQGQRCKECGKKKISHKKCIYTLNFVKDFFKKNNCEIIQINNDGDFVKTFEKIKYKCCCGNLSEIIWGSFLKGTRCKICGIKKRSNKIKMSIDFIKDFFKENKCLLLSNEYENCEMPMDYICQCGCPSKISWSNFRKGKRCRKCGTKSMCSKRKKSIDLIKHFFLQKGCELLEDENTYKNAKMPMDYICQCGNYAKISWDSFRNGHVGCKECKNKKIGDAQRGERSRNWNPDISQEDRELSRKIPGYNLWRKKVFKRDNYKCDVCSSNKFLNAHHLKGYTEFPELRTNEDNGVTLCQKCHNEFHSKHGKKNITEIHYNEFKRTKTDERFMLMLQEDL